MKTMKFFRAAVLSVAALAAGAAPALAAGGDGPKIKDVTWSFEGPLGRFDRAQLQRGWQIYAEVCASCHSMKYLRYGDLGRKGGPEFPADQVEAIAATFEVPDVGPDGQAITRPAIPTDALASPFPNRKAAEATLGAYPPDLSLITKKRTGFHGILTQMFKGTGGAEYVYALLTGYTEAPAGFKVPDGAHFNPYFKDFAIKMLAPLPEDRVTYQDGTKATTEQMALDITAFLAWAAEPKMEERKRAGLANIIFLSIFAVLLWFSTKKLWKPIKNGEDA
ncbi:MAG: cytochrome c1 [Neomegalonema sp.]|nr:cytochrome c1 [Neomegalonema sp.]